MKLPPGWKEKANYVLAAFNVRIDSLTRERLETQRLVGMEAKGHFERPVFPVLGLFTDCNPLSILAEVNKYEPRFSEFSSASREGPVFSLANGYFDSPDAEVLYAFVRLYRPCNIIEVGSGNSTLLFRHAIADGGLNARLVSIDPHPRRDITRYPNEIIRTMVEDLPNLELFCALRANDILFIDSSHDIRAGNDVLFLFLHVLPLLKPGVLIHIHDIFLPYEYPRTWLVINRWSWTEQYLVQAILQNSSEWEVLWCGQYFQRNLPGFNARFVQWRGGSASSLWLRKRQINR